MFDKLVPGLFAIAAAVAPLSAAPAPPRFSPSTSFEARLLAAHNLERFSARAVPLAWDPALAAGAAVHARYLASTGLFVHSNRQARRGIGENLWMGTSRSFAPEQMVGTWTAERRYFVPGIFPNVSRSGNWMDVGHYTQVIWPTTTRVGCALASGRGRDVLVCRYAAAGNIDGRPVLTASVSGRATR